MGILELYHLCLSSPHSHLQKSLKFQCFLFIYLIAIKSSPGGLSSPLFLCESEYSPGRCQLRTEYECSSHSDATSLSDITIVLATAQCDSLACIVPALTYVGMRGYWIGVKHYYLYSFPCLFIMSYISCEKCWWKNSWERRFALVFAFFEAAQRQDKAKYLGGEEQKYLQTVKVFQLRE